MTQHEAETRPQEFIKAKPERLPKPTYWPFFMALGLMFMCWGLLTIWIISAAGFVVFVLSLGAWINILRHERRNKE